MGSRECGKCGEMVDEAKAFCPGCGHAFVEEEKRQKASEFERLENTVQIGDTMYNQMLSEMGLNISKAEDAGEKRIEVIAPVGEEPPVPVKPAAVAPAEAAVKPQPSAGSGAKPSGRLKWVILGILAFLLFFPAALASTVSLVFEIWSRSR